MSGATLTISNATLNFNKLGFIEVRKGAKLVIENSTLTKCGTENWQGIRAYTNNISGPEGEVIIDDSVIEYAKVGLSLGRKFSWCIG